MRHTHRREFPSFSRSCHACCRRCRLPNSLPLRCAQHSHELAALRARVPPLRLSLTRPAPRTGLRIYLGTTGRVASCAGIRHSPGFSGRGYWLDRSGSWISAVARDYWLRGWSVPEPSFDERPHLWPPEWLAPPRPTSFRGIELRWRDVQRARGRSGQPERNSRSVTSQRPTLAPWTPS